MMVIHVVSQNETLQSIATQYKVAATKIAEINGLPANHRLVIGETLLIPLDHVYYVQEGDTLWTIAQKAGVPHQALERQNPGLAGKTLQIGQPIQLPSVKRSKILTNGFMEPMHPPHSLLPRAYPALTYLSIFSYHVESNGQLIKPKVDDWIAALKNVSTKPLMTITNVKDTQFDRQLAATIFESDKAQDRLFQNILRELREKGYRGVVVDFEYLGSGTKQKYTRFLKRLTSVLHKDGYLVFTAVAPKTSGEQTGAWYEAHDYGAHGKIADGVILMTYEWGWSGGPPMAVSPLTQVEKVVQYAKSVIPSRKIIMSLPLYGYDWTLPYVKGGKFAKPVSTPLAYQIAMQHGVDVKYDEKAAAPFFRYHDGSNKEHIVYFNDLRTVSALSQLVNRYQLAGISFWNLAFPYPAIWPFLSDRFDIRH